MKNKISRAKLKVWLKNLTDAELMALIVDLHKELKNRPRGKL